MEMTMLRIPLAFEARSSLLSFAFDFSPAAALFGFAGRAVVGAGRTVMGAGRIAMGTGRATSCTCGAGGYELNGNACEGALTAASKATAAAAAERSCRSRKSAREPLRARFNVC